MEKRIDNIVLGSASPRRLELLRSLGLNVRVVPSTYDEPEHPHMTPRELAIVHARHKCYDVLRRLQATVDDPPGIVVTADTVVDVDNLAYNKPRDAQDAKGMLQDLSGRTHIVHTAIALAVPGHEGLIEHCESTFVTFYPLDDEEIDAYVQSGEPMDKAGAYGIQGYGATLVERVEGDFYTVMGFPLGRFVRTLRRLGFLLPITKEADTSHNTTG
ncbi:MAG TPA: nucleoside triphosphate pyrophosphatase [Candidatus Baltobacteraceae bacterium]|jgi:septum formation protein|nr:nucleoside triphosphate pyrophosphatase [Candidatus Baltobacteraceae bacterium]